MLLLCQVFEPVATDPDMRPSWFESRAYRQCFGISSFFPPVLNIALPLAGCTGAFVALGFVVVSGTSGVPGVALILACFGGASLSGMAHHAELLAHHWLYAWRRCFFNVGGSSLALYGLALALGFLSICSLFGTLL